MKSSGITNLTLIVGALVLILAIGIYISAKSFDEQIDGRQWVIHTYQVLQKIDNLLSDLSSAETDERTFLLLGDQKTLTAYNKAAEKTTDGIGQLRQLVSDNPPQVARVDKFNKSVSSFLNRMQVTMQSRPKEAFKGAQELLLDDTVYGDGHAEVEKIAEKVSAVEQELLQKRLKVLQETTQSTQRCIAYVNGMFIVSLLVIIWIYSSSQEKAERNLALQHSISKVLNESQDLSEAIQKIEKIIVERGKWLAASTWLLNEKENCLRCYDVWGDPAFKDAKFLSETREKKFQSGEGLPGRVWASLQAASIPKLSKDASFTRIAQAEASGLQSGMAFPIINQTKFLGVIEMFADRPRTLDAQTRAIFESVGREIGRLIERQQSSMRFKAILDSTFQFIGFLDTAGSVIDINETALNFAGITLADVKGLPFWEAPWWTHSAPQQERLKDAISRAAHGEFIRFEAHHPAPDGTIATVDFSVKPVFDADGQVKYLIPEGRDISEKKDAESKFRAVFDQTFSLVGILKTDGTILDANQSALDYIGSTLEEVVGKPFWTDGWFSQNNDAQETIRQNTLRAATGELVRFEIRSASITGELIDFDVTIKPVLDRSGKIQMLIPEARNITETKEAERRVSEFYSTVSHELRTPLTSIRGSLGLIEGGLTGEVNETTIKMVVIARSESDRLIRLINDILDLQKIEAGMVELKNVNVEASTLVSRTLENIQGMANTLEVRLSSQIETTGLIYCDPDRIVQVLTNLISNAMKFSPANALVLVKLTQAKNNSFRFSVVDNGPGIPPEQAHKLFARFQQLDQSDSRQKGGTGLGLAITKAIVEEHKGRISVDSELGKGSTFWFELPASYEPPHGQETDTVESTDGLPEAHVRPALLIEDDDGIAEVLKANLKHAGFEVVRASTLKQAQALLNKYTPLVILLDLTLPDGDGLDLLSTLSNDQSRKHIPVVIVSGRDTDGGVQCSTPALIDWLEKPLNEERLYEALNRARKLVGPARVLLVEDDPSAREIMMQQLNALGITCLEAKDGAEAITAFRESNPDLIILDLSIPPPDGFSVIEILRSEPNGNKPLIVYTASDLSNEQKQMLKLGLTAHLTKSVHSIDQVIKTVKDFLDGLISPKAP